MGVLEVWKSIILPLASAVIGGWLTALFALGRFQKGKLWERKTEAYTAIFAALHDMGRWFDDHFDATERGTEIPMDRQTEMSRDYRRARDALYKRIAGESWVLPSDCIDRIGQLRKQLDVEDHDWIKILDAHSFAISTAMDDLRRLVRRDLSMEPRSLRRRIAEWFSSA